MSWLEKTVEEIDDALFSEMTEDQVRTLIVFLRENYYVNDSFSPEEVFSFLDSHSFHYYSNRHHWPINAFLDAEKYEIPSWLVVNWDESYKAYAASTSDVEVVEFGTSIAVFLTHF